MFDGIRNQHRTTITIDNSDWEYMQKHHLKASHLVRAMVRDHRVHTEDPLAAPTTREMHDKIKNISARLNNLLRAAEELMSKKQFDKLMQKI